MIKIEDFEHNISSYECFLKAKKILESYSIKHEFSEYSRGYLFATEYINRYLKDNNFHKDKALTVLASGDQIFNLVYLDVFNIDAFDINKLNYFTFYLKYAFILNLTYKEFKNLEHTIAKDYYLPAFMGFLDRCKDILPGDVYIYFKELVYYEYSLNKSNGLRNLYFRARSVSSNIYLESESNYKELQRKIEKLKLKIYFQDIKDIPGFVDGNYDLILLSNISDYLGDCGKLLTLEEFRNYLNIFKSLLKNDGLLINYLYGLGYKYIIDNSHITLNDLGEYNVLRLGLKGEGYLRVRK